jgi:SAM-dependent methyltransferase
LSSSNLENAAAAPVIWDLDNAAGYANAMGRYRTEKEKEFILRHLPAGPLRVLDIGGSTGRFAVQLASRGHEVTVVDVCTEALRRLDQRGLRKIVTIPGDFLNLDFQAEFDIALGIESVQFFTSVPLDTLFDRVHRSLRDGGRFVFTALNARSWRWALRTLRPSATHHYVADTLPGYRRALYHAGLSVRSIDGFMWMPMTATSNSRFVPAFASVESRLRLTRWLTQSPWLLIAADKPTRPDQRPVVDHPRATTRAGVAVVRHTLMPEATRDHRNAD